MTKFEEMCKAYDSHLKNVNDYRQECLRFAKDLVEGFISYCGIPQQQLSICKVDEEGEAIYHPSILSDFMKLETGGFCHLWIGLMICLYSSLLSYRQFILIKFTFKKEAHNIILSLNPEIVEYQNYKINLDPNPNDLELQKVYDFIAKLICSNFENAFESFLSGQAEDRVLGFSLNSV